MSVAATARSEMTEFGGCHVAYRVAGAGPAVVLSQAAPSAADYPHLRLLADSLRGHPDRSARVWSQW